MPVIIDKHKVWVDPLIIRVDFVRVVSHTQLRFTNIERKIERLPLAATLSVLPKQAPKRPYFSGRKYPYRGLLPFWTQ